MGRSHEVVINIQARLYTTERVLLVVPGTHRRIIEFHLLRLGRGAGAITLSGRRSHFILLHFRYLNVMSVFRHDGCSGHAINASCKSGELIWRTSLGRAR